MRAEAGVQAKRGAASARASERLARLARERWRALVWPLAALLALLLAIGVVFAGSIDRIAAGVTVAGVDVGGMTAAEAEALLDARAARQEGVPLVFTAGEERWPITPRDVQARVDWAGAAAEARAAGDWPLPLRGLKRVVVRLTGEDVAPHVRAYEPALTQELTEIADSVDRPGRNASIVLNGLAPRIVPSSSGRKLDRREARAQLLAAFGSFERGEVAAPIRIDPPAVTAEELAPVAEQVRTVLSAPVRFGWRDAHWLMRPQQLAKFLALPTSGSKEIRIGGAEADRYFELLSRAVNRRPKNADFVVESGTKVRILPSANGRKLDVRATADALLAGALETRNRDAELVVRTVEPKLTTEQARQLGVSRVLASYSTPYSGTYDRIRNLQLAVWLLDGTRVAPGGTFSFNRAVGPRTEARGFRPAPVIMEGKFEDGVGGGVSQVATTVFNAAWEAGVKITSRTPHALYLSRYPLGRDATVNYPEIDMKFQNDTDRWIVVKAAAGDTGISVTLLGAPTGRRVVTQTGELEEVAPPEIERVPDPTLYEGEKVVVDDGEPARAVSVTRIVYEGDEVLYRETWHTSYISEPRIVRVGTMPRPAEEEEPVPGGEEPKKDEGDDATPPPAGEEPVTPPGQPAPPPPPAAGDVGAGA